MWFGIQPASQLVFAAAAVAAVALSAGLAPVRGAARVDPNVALRYE